MHSSKTIKYNQLIYKRYKSSFFQNQMFFKHFSFQSIAQLALELQTSASIFLWLEFHNIAMCVFVDVLPLNAPIAYKIQYELMVAANWTAPKQPVIRQY